MPGPSPVSTRVGGDSNMIATSRSIPSRLLILCELCTKGRYLCFRLLLVLSELCEAVL